MSYPNKYRVQIRELSREFCELYSEDPESAIKMLSENLQDKPHIFVRQTMRKIQYIYPEFNYEHCGPKNFNR